MDQRVDRLELLICPPRPRTAMPLGQAAASSCDFANLCLTLRLKKAARALTSKLTSNLGKTRRPRLMPASGSAKTWRSSMQTPVEIDFQGLKGNDQLRACVMKNISVLEQRFGRITACRVVIRRQASGIAPAAPARSRFDSRYPKAGKLISAAPKRPKKPTIVSPTRWWP